ncbi:MAG: TRZ/ATZ family hydrolase [Woeseiaceae bacterium]|nr:TRZ/ATZ family hydrolase [Woeseiaceae bacterium]
MKHCDTLILPRWCVPVEPAADALTGHAVAVADGRILDVLPAAEAAEKYQPSVTLERDSHVLIPGLVNAHTHAAMTLFRGISDVRPLERWLKEAIWPVEKRWVSPDFVRDGAELAITEMLKGGVTCFADQYFFPEVVAEAANALNIRAVVGTPILDFPTPWANDVAEYLSKAADLVHDPYVDHPLVNTCWAPHSSSALSDDGFRELRVLADQLDIPVQIHLHETEAEIAASIMETGERPFERLDRLGLVNSLMLAVHAVHMTDDEVARMADANVAIAHCPKSNLKLGSGMAPVSRYLEAGIRVGLGTDGAASNNALDLISEMQTAALISRVSGAEPLSAAQALTTATLGSARAIGLGRQTGSIVAGKWADLTCVDLSTINSQPVHNPVDQLVFASRADQVSDVWVGGRHVLDAGRLTHINEGNVLERTAEWRERINPIQGTA